MPILNVMKMPIPAQAIIYTGKNEKFMADLLELTGSIEQMQTWFCWVEEDDGYAFYIQTLEGRMLVTLGSYIIKGNINEYWSSKAEVFTMTYKIMRGPIN
ncbi:hypothetical protein HCA73_16145 [Listeria booriae]|uniref:hypothetical protein n=1 Tax=Listeria booriae TaxID=1552123 RepID=UPI001623D962|nr:hypothetical protein [Listeria booriae]MBC1914184.1 hypothetical protein [Listeria booriae]